ncbi:TetR/AcrR family transcriptional regulator [Pseudonocardia sp. KRD-291]|nr:TetR/AcrR family transcriptional regulator [Pseudonocardia sp. KRD291]
MVSRAGTDERRTDTREQIRDVALELFAEQGYERTSLREIAERLGVTKAAVYYHYRTKEEILESLFSDLFHGIDEIVGWGSAQPPGPETRRGVLERYSALLSGPGSRFDRTVRFLQEGQNSIKELPVGAEMKARFHALSELLADPEASVAEQLRRRLALMALHLGAFATDQLGGDADERREAALEVARELV